MSNLYYKLNNGYYNLYILVNKTLIGVKLSFKNDYRLIKALIDSGVIKPLDTLKKGE